MASSAAPASSAVAEKIWSLEELSALAKEQEKDFKQQWKLNNTALKYMRWAGEKPEGVPLEDGYCWVVPIDIVVEIGEMEHDAKGPGFSFDSPAVAGKMQRWSATQFLANLRPDAIAAMELKEHGVRKLECAHIPNSLDKMRVAAAKQLGKPFADDVKPPIWDFILTRGDGERFAIHPSQANYKCQFRKFVAGDDWRGYGRGGVKKWQQNAYGDAVHGLYEVGLDPVRDEHRRKHLEWLRSGGTAPAVTGPQQPQQQGQPQQQTQQQQPQQKQKTQQWLADTSAPASAAAAAAPAPAAAAASTAPAVVGPQSVPQSAAAPAAAPAAAASAAAPAASPAAAAASTAPAVAGRKIAPRPTTEHVTRCYSEIWYWHENEGAWVYFDAKEKNWFFWGK